jgi:hypothetical protein
LPTIIKAYSLNITGKWYGREDDNIGIGYAYLKGHLLDFS